MRKKKADAVKGDVLAENKAKIDSYEKSIKEALERKRKVIIESKLYTYGQLSELYGGAEGQELIDAVTAEHTLISKLTANGMTYEQIGELADDNKGGHQMSFTDKKNPYED